LGQLRSATGLSTEDFKQFAANCELDFGTSISLSPGMLTDGSSTPSDDVEHIRSRLFAAVQSPQYLIEMSRDELLNLLGWTDHFTLRRLHDFPVDYRLYRPIAGTVDAVSRSLDALSGGYVAILGGPGSGKSTLLTHLLRQRPERVIKYYAFIPGTGEALKPRGESESFLHDLVCQIADAGFVADPMGNVPKDRLALQATLHEQLRLLQLAHADTGLKTIVLVDGLDHVPREYQPDRSFLRDLPLPNEIPDGVLFVLGSQTDQLDDLSPELRQSIQGPERRINVGRLSRASVHDLTDRVLPGRTTAEQKEIAFDLCDGHPLALRYLLNALSASQDIDTALREAHRFDGTIGVSYETYWTALTRSSPRTARLLTLLSRMRQPLHMRWILRWADSEDIQNLRSCAGHYFRRGRGHRWSFFHNSFRHYVQRVSATNALGEHDALLDKAFHQELAELYSQHGIEYQHRLEELYHRAMQGDDVAVLSICQQAFFRDAAQAGLPVDRIVDAIHLGIEAASRMQDARALLRLAFALKEVHQRGEEEDEAAIVELLLELKDFDRALEHICDGTRLLVGPSTALECSLALLQAGRDAEAHSLFELAEPVDVLAKRVHVDGPTPFYDRDDLSTWAAVAVHFRSAEEVLGLIDSLDSDPPPEHSQMAKQEFLDRIRNQMRLEVGEELLHMGQWDAFREVRDIFTPDDEAGFPYWLRLTLDAIRRTQGDGDTGAAATEMALLLGVVNPHDCDEITRTAVAQHILSSGGDTSRVREWVVDIEQPSMVDHLYSRQESDLSPWRQRLRLNSLLYALDDSHPTPRVLVPDTTDPRDTGHVLFERAICQLAKFRGLRWRGALLHRTDICEAVLGLLRLFNQDWRKTRDWTGWYSIQAARGSYYEELVTELSQHTSGCLQQLMALFEEEWSSPRGQYWPSDVIRRAVVRAYDCGMPRHWTIQWLGSIDDDITDLDVNGRVQHYLAQARAWLTVGETSRVHDCIRRIRQSSLGVGYRKDYQTNTWIQRLREHLQSHPDDAPRLLPWMSCAVASLEDTTERAAREAAPELVELTFQHTPRNAVELVQWFGARRIYSWHESGLAAVIRAATESSSTSVELLLAVAVDLYMPLATYVTAEDVPLHVARHVLSNMSEQNALGVLDAVAGASDVLSLDVTRAGWRQGLDLAIDRTGHTQRYARADSGDSDDGVATPSSGAIDAGSIELANGQQLTREEVLERCSTYDGLCSCLREVEGVHAYRLEPVLRTRLVDLSSEQLLELAGLLRTKGRTEILLAVGYRLQALGDVRSARSLAEEALESSYRFSQEWRGHQTEGSAIALLKRIDPARAKRVAYQAIAREMEQHSFTGYELATRIPDVLRLLQSDLALEELWPEIEEHLQALFDEEDIARMQAPGFGPGADDDTPNQALVDLLVAHATHPCNDVRLGAIRGLARVVKAGCQEAVKAIRLALAGKEEQQWHLIPLVESLSFDTPESIAPWKDEMTSLGDHANYAIRAIAQSTCARLGWAADTPTRVDLPASYRLWLPDDLGGVPVVDASPPSGEVRPDTDNPQIMIRPFDLDARILAEMAGFEPNAVYARIALLMRQIEPYATWCADAEKQHLDELKAVGPQFPYRRPRAHVARRALFRVAAELVDANRLSAEEQELFLRHARTHDPAFLLQTGCQRPPILALPPGREYPQELDEWKAQGDPGACVHDLDGLIVLGEDSLFKSLGDDHLRERRQSAITPESWLTESPGASVDLLKRLHQVVLGGTVANYPVLRRIPRDPVIANRLDGSSSPGGDWLAVNPFMADHFGWSCDENGRWFAWRDANGDVMVRSLWWQDGLVGHISRALHSWVSEGWLVLASPSAVSLIEQELGPLRVVRCVTRAAGRDDRGATATVVIPASLQL